MRNYFTIVKYEWKGQHPYHNSGDGLIYNSYDEAAKALDDAGMVDDDDAGIYYRIMEFNFKNVKVTDIFVVDIFLKETDTKDTETSKIFDFVDTDFLISK